MRILGFVLLLLPHAAFAQRASNACFTPDEAITMVQKREVFSKAAADCLKKYWDTHTSFYKQNHYSKYFGNRNQSLNSADKRKKILLLRLWPNFPQTLRADEAAALKSAEALSDFEKYYQQKDPAAFADYQRKIAPLQLDVRAADEPGGPDALQPNTKLSLQNISCVDMARRCLYAGFKAAGMTDTWKKVDTDVVKHDVSGTQMQKALADLGWMILFWNPDPSRNAEFDADDRKANPLPTTPDPATGKIKKWQGSWGDAAYSYSYVMKHDAYPLGGEKPVPVDDKTLLVGFGTTPPAKFKALPFFVGTAHAGYHVFPGFYGRIIEAHSVRALTGFDNLQVSSFNPLDQAHGGGPVWTNSEHYKSGIIAVPPGYLENVSVLHKPAVDAEGCVDVHADLPGEGSTGSSSGAATGVATGGAMPAVKRLPANSSTITQ